MFTPPSFTRRELRRWARKNHYSIAEAETYYPEFLAHAEFLRLTAEFNRLKALDPTEYKELADSAHWNALDSCQEEGFGRTEDHPYYLQMLVATLSMLLDEAGIAQ